MNSGADAAEDGSSADAITCFSWLLARLDPLQFGTPTAKALAAATGDPRERSRQSLPDLTASLTDIADVDCPIESADQIDERLGEMS